MAKVAAEKKVATKGGKPVKKEAKKPEPAEKVPGLDVGLRSGERVVQFINGKLIEQRKAMYNDPRTMLSDDDLSMVFGKEFPKKEKFQEISSYRNYFNGALAGMGDPPYVDGNKIPDGKRLYSKERAYSMWEKGTLKPKCGLMPDNLKKKKPKSKDGESKKSKKEE